MCEHATRGPDAVQVLAQAPFGALLVRCPCCSRSGWRAADDPDPSPMTCPVCGVQAVTQDADASDLAGQQ